VRAVQIQQYGDASNLTVVDIPELQPGPGQVLVTVHGASINPFDLKVLQGAYKDSPNLLLPFTLGGDIAGFVKAVGDGVTGFIPGDKVFGQANVIAGNSGAFAEQAVTKTEQLAKAPNSIPITTVASLPLVGSSAMQAMSEHFTIQPDTKLFIHGGGGGIGAIALQIAKRRKAYVAVTATGEDIEYVKLLGADEVIDYKTQDFTTMLQDYSVVFDTVGGDEFNRSFAILKPGGVAVSMTATADPELEAKQQISAYTQSTRVTTVVLDQVREYIEANIIKPRVADIFPLADIAAAFAAFQAGPHGKIVLQIGS
jgi:NADPH:quinone reductase-like Zn-dependent oxidoreductase